MIHTVFLYCRTKSSIFLIKMTTYSVVHFIEDESVEAVPSCWVKGHFCAWPKNKNCESKYIQSKHRAQ